MGLRPSHNPLIFKSQKERNVQEGLSLTTECMYVCMCVCVCVCVCMHVCMDVCSGQIAQVVEHQTADPWVAGSSLTSGEKCKSC